jgi:hypothetical protein
MFSRFRVHWIHLCGFAGVAALGLACGCRPAGNSSTTTAKNPGPFTYPKGVWTESPVATGTPVHLWRSEANDNSSAVSFLFADKQNVHLVIVSSDGRIAHQDIFAGIIQFNSENFKGVSGYHGLQYLDDKSNLARTDLETMPGSRWLVWRGLQVSDDAKSWLYTVYVDGKWHVISPAGDLATSDSAPPLSLAKSGAGYGALLLRGKDSVLLLSGKEQVLPGIEAGYLELSPDGKRYALFLEQSPGKWSIDVDGKIDSRQFDSPADIQFSPDSSRVAYVAELGKASIGLEYGTAAEVQHPSRSPQFSADSHHVAWVVSDGAGRCSIIADGKPSQTFTGVSRPVLSDDGTQVSFLALVGGKTHLFVNNMDKGTTQDPGWMFFDPTGKRVAIPVGTGRGNEHAMRVDGQDGPTFQGQIDEGTFGPDGAKIAYHAVRAGKIVLVVGGSIKETDYNSVFWDSGAFRSSGIFRGLGITGNQVTAFKYAP